MVDRARERSNTKDGNRVLVTGFSKNADVAKLADAQVSGSCGQPCKFKSCHPHQKSTNFDKKFVDFFLSIEIAYTKQKRWQWFIDKEKMYAIIRSRLQTE